jgi:hypothetical protein
MASPEKRITWLQTRTRYILQEQLESQEAEDIKEKYEG